MKHTPKTLTASQIERLETRLTRKLTDRTQKQSRKARRGEKHASFAAMMIMSR